MGRSTWYCIDIEASGPVPSLFDMISLGAVAVHEKEDGTLQLGDSFYVEIVPTAEGWEEEAEKIHGLSKNHLMEHGVARRTAMQQLNDWVAATRDPGSDATFVPDCVCMGRLDARCPPTQCCGALPVPQATSKHKSQLSNTYRT